MDELKTNTADQQQVSEDGEEAENVSSSSSEPLVDSVNVPPTTCVCYLHFVPSCCCVHWCPNTRLYCAHLPALTFSISILSHQNTKYNSVRCLRSCANTLSVWRCDGRNTNAFVSLFNCKKDICFPSRAQLCSRLFHLFTFYTVCFSCFITDLLSVCISHQVCLRSLQECQENPWCLTHTRFYMHV